MNKNLETEYKNAVMNDLPDLWDRIEAALPSVGEDDNDKNDSVKVFDNKNNTETPVNVIPAKSVKKKKNLAWVKIVVPMAALGIVLIAPAILFFSRQNTKNVYFYNQNLSDSAPSTMAEVETEVQEPGCEAPEEKSESLDSKGNANFDYQVLSDEKATYYDSLKTDHLVKSAGLYFKTHENIGVSFEIESFDTEKENINEAVIRFAEDVNFGNITLFCKDSNLAVVIDNEEILSEETLYQGELSMDQDDNYHIVVNFE